MTREQTYKAQLEELGIYRKAFDPEIRMLADMERELQRMRKEWKAQGSPAESKLREAIVKQRRDILAHRDALGLTPKGLHRIKREVPEEQGKKQERGNVLQLIQDRRRKEA